MTNIKRERERETRREKHQLVQTVHSYTTKSEILLVKNEPTRRDDKET